MTDNIVSLDFNGVKILLDSNTKLKRLFEGGTGSNTSWHDTETGADYQVPTGKKATIIYLEAYKPTANTQLASTTAADAATGGEVLIDTNSATEVTNTIFISDELVASDYLTTITAGLNGTGNVIWLIEESAT